MASDRLYELNGKKGHWYTDDQGNRYFVAQGQTPKEGWEATKRRKMIKGGKYVKDDGDDKGEQEISANEYETYEADEEERFDETTDADFEDEEPEGFDKGDWKDDERAAHIVMGIEDDLGIEISDAETYNAVMNELVDRGYTRGQAAGMIEATIDDAMMDRIRSEINDDMMRDDYHNDENQDNDTDKYAGPAYGEEEGHDYELDALREREERGLDNDIEDPKEGSANSGSGPQTANIDANVNEIAKEVSSKFGEANVKVDEKGHILLKDPEGFEPVAIADEDEIPAGAIVKIMPNWREPNENPDDTYFVKEDRGNSLLLWSPSKSSSFGGYTYEWPKNTMYIPPRMRQGKPSEGKSGPVKKQGSEAQKTDGSKNAEPQSSESIEKDVNSYNGGIEGVDEHMKDICDKYGCRFITSNKISDDTVEVCIGGITGNEWFKVKNTGSNANPHWYGSFKLIDYIKKSAEKSGNTINTAFDYLKKLYDDPKTRVSAIRKTVEKFPNASNYEIGRVMEKLIEYSKGKK